MEALLRTRRFARADDATARHQHTPAPPAPAVPGIERVVPLNMPPAGLLVLKDGHVGSEWFAESVSRQPGTKFLFEMGPCITGSLSSKLAFFSAHRRGCTCTKEDCAAFRGELGTKAPCMDAPSASACRVLGGSHMSMASEREIAQWEKVLHNGTDDRMLIVVQTRSNLVKWAWSFYRTGAMKRLRRRDTPSQGMAAPPADAKERIHLREGDEADGGRSNTPVRVDPWVLLRMIVAKQARSERLLLTARRFAKLTPQKRERLVLYESMQNDLQGELQRLYRAMRVPFDVAAHAGTTSKGGVATTPPLIKHATEDLSSAIANFDELERAFSAFPCLHAMLTDRKRRVFDDCSTGDTGRAADAGVDPSAPCGCSWRTPILDQNGTRIDEEWFRARARMGEHSLAAAVFTPTARLHSTAAAAATATATTEVLDACGRAVHAANVALVVVVTWPQLHAAIVMALGAAGLALTGRRSAAMAVALGFVVGHSLLAS
jgi:hypothetical protein